MEALLEVAPAAAAVEVDFSLTVLASGSSGNASLVSFGDTHLLIDAGLSAKELFARMELRGFDPANLTAVLVTHEHSDHIKSVHTISHKLKIPLIATEGTFRVAVEGKRYFEFEPCRAGRPLNIGGIEIHPITLPHDAVDPIGFRFESGGRILAHLTDFGYPSGLLIEALRGCHTVLVEANHDVELLKDGPYPWSLKQRIASRTGHLSNDSLLEMLPDIVHDGLRHLILAHISDTNNDTRLLQVSVKRALTRLGYGHLPFTLALQDAPLETLRV